MKKYYLHRETTGLKLNYEKELNKEQHVVVMHPGGHMLVLAGAGTGKTRTVTYRVARLIETGIRPENILLLTFTNKAEKEMMRRAEFLIGINIQGLWGGTFHHIRQFHKKLLSVKGSGTRCVSQKALLMQYLSWPGLCPKRLLMPFTSSLIF
jgi:hypothetical protein